MRIILFLLLTTASASAAAQIGAGRWLLAANGFGSGTRSATEPEVGTLAPRQDSRSWSGTLSLRAGYFTSPNWALGAIATQRNTGGWTEFWSLSSFSGATEQRFSNAVRQSSVGAFARYYRWLGAKKRFALFAEGALSYSSTQSDDFSEILSAFSMITSRQVTQRTVRTRGAVLDGAIGAVYRVNRWLGMEVLASLGSLRHTVRETNTSNDFNGSVSATFIRNAEFQSSFSPNVNTSVLTVGFQFYLGGEQSSE